MTVVVLTAVVAALVAGPFLAALALRIAATYRTLPDDADPERDVAVGAPAAPPARPGPVRIAVVTLALAGLLAGAGAVVGLRPVLLALAWTAGAAVVLAPVDLAVHRLPDRVVFPSMAVVVAAQLLDAVVVGTWDELLRAVLAGLAAFAVAAAAAMISPGGMGFGDVKLIGLLGLLLGWFGWALLLLGVLLGFVVGALGALVLIAGRRAGWRTEVALGPSLLIGAALALGLAAAMPA